MTGDRSTLAKANLVLLGAAGLTAVLGLAAPPFFGLTVVLLGVLAFTGPAQRWGNAGLLLTPGLLLVLVGLAVLTAGTVGAALVTEVNEDNDRDGRINEDPPGDADGSASDPTQVSGVAEARNHADDDADGRVDEDPFAPLGSRTALAAASSIGAVLSVLGALAIVAFLAFARRRGRRAGAAASPPAGP